MDKTTSPLTGSAAQAKVLEGVTAVFNVISPTLGPAGKAVLVNRTYNRGPRVADDGYLAAENVLLRDPHARLAAETYKEGIKKTNLMAGDGTTGTGVLSYHAYKTAHKLLPQESIGGVPLLLAPGKKPEKLEKKSVRQIRKEMHDAKDLVLAEIKKSAKPIKSLADLEKVALVSLGKEDEVIAKTVAKMVWEVARDQAGNYIDNHIDVTDGYKGEVETEITQGMRIPAKVSANAFINRLDRHEMVAEDTPVFITNHKLDSVMLTKVLIESLMTAKLAIFAPDFSSDVLKYMVALCQNNGFTLFPIKSPSLRTVQLEDLAIYTGAKVLDKEQAAKLENATPDMLGFADKIIVKSVENREDAVVLGGRGEKTKRGASNLIAERIKVLKGQLKETRTDLERGTLEKRIANLSSSTGVIRVASSTEGDALFLKLKIEDAVYACKGALEEGYVKGGGLALKEIAEKLPENILTEALKSPYNQIQKNAGGDLEISKDVIDPAKVVRMIVEHAVTVAASLITIHAIVPETPEKTEAQGLEMVAKALSKIAYYEAKHKGQLKESEDEAEQDRQAEFDRIMFEDKQG